MYTALYEAAAAAAADVASQRVRWACLTLSLGAWHSMHECILCIYVCM